MTSVSDSGVSNAYDRINRLTLEASIYAATTAATPERRVVLLGSGEQGTTSRRAPEMRASEAHHPFGILASADQRDRVVIVVSGRKTTFLSAGRGGLASCNRSIARQRVERGKLLVSAQLDRWMRCAQPRKSSAIEQSTYTYGAFYFVSVTFSLTRAG